MTEAGVNGEIHLVEGPVGAGKSTYCQSVAAKSGAVHVALDQWFSRLFSPDRPEQDVMLWYAERKNRLIDQIWHHALDLSAARVTPVLELGLIRRADREAIYRRATCAGVSLAVTVIDAPREVRRERVEQRNRSRGPTYSMSVPPEIFEMASDLWEAPDAMEIQSRGIQIIAG